jgi:tetratricopeptide (TPR) repeat protein
MQLGDFNDAFENYVLLIRNEPKNQKYQHEAGLALFEGSFDKTKALSFFERALKYSDGKPNAEIFYYLGRSYHYYQNFLYAIAAYLSFSSVLKDNKAGEKQIKEIDKCRLPTY